jgi:predicted RNase H-like HicB family nuclease
LVGVTSSASVNVVAAHGVTGSRRRGAGGDDTVEVRVSSTGRRDATFESMRTFTAVVERDPTTGLLVGYIPGWPGAHTQADNYEELHTNLREVVALLLEDGEPQLEAEFIGTQTVEVA